MKRIKKTNPIELLLETSWEVCNKQGGIYTVLSSRACEMMRVHDSQVVFVGPLLAHEGGELPRDFDNSSVPEVLKHWSETERANLGLRTEVGTWRVPGTPAVVLVDFTPLWEQKGDLYYRMWSQYGMQSDKGYGDYDECSLFAIASARVMHSILKTSDKMGRAIAIFNEWQTAMGLLYSKWLHPELKTMFITHATTVGRSISGNGKELYAWMHAYNGDQMACELAVEAKHGIEKRAAHTADIFATVSKLTARECTQLIERTPVVLPNGFEQGFVPHGRAYDQARKEARTRLAEVATRLTGHSITDKDFFISLGGRYEYRNKGIDLFVETIAELRRSYHGRKRITAFLLVPGWVAEARADLAYLLEHPEEATTAPLQHPTLTHWLHNMDTDATQGHLRYLGLDRVHDKVNIIVAPVYLDGYDGIMNMSYYDLLVGMDQTIYPSYYEPWGYTPLESIAFGVPTITTRLAGFGLWAEEELVDDDLYLEQQAPVCVLERTDHNQSEVIAAIASQVMRQALGKVAPLRTLRRASMTLAEKAAWKHFYQNYLQAYQTIF